MPIHKNSIFRRKISSILFHLFRNFTTVQVFLPYQRRVALSGGSEPAGTTIMAFSASAIRMLRRVSVELVSDTM